MTYNIKSIKEEFKANYKDYKENEEYDQNV